MRSRVVLVTCDGRGYPMALELARKSIPTTVLDFSKAFKREPNDVGGPVGLFDPAGTGATKRWELSNVFPVDEREVGFTVWTGQGPLEFRGPMGMHQWRSHGLEERLSEYLSIYMNQPPQINWSEVQFEKVWPLHLANVLTMTSEKAYPESLKERWRTPLFSSYSHVDYSDVSKELSDLEARGLTVIRCSEMRDVRIGPVGISSLDVRSESTDHEVFGTELFSFLTRKEWEQLNASVAKSIFKNPSVPAAYRWQRWELGFQSHRLLDSLPDEVLVLGDMYDVWRADNLAIVKKGQGSFHVWMKVSQTSETEDLRRVLERFVARFTERVPGLELESVRLGSQEPVWSVWEGSGRMENVELEVSNCKMLGPDGGERFDTLARWHHGEAMMTWLMARVLQREGEKEVQP